MEIEIIMFTIVYILTGIILLVTPTMSRNNIFFGVKIPSSFRKRQEYRKVKSDFLFRGIILLIISLGLLLIAYSIYKSEVVFAVFLFISLGTSFVNIYVSYKNVLKLKSDENIKNKKSTVIIDTKLSRNRNANLVSPWWFIIAVIIVVLNVILVLKFYDGIPNPIPVKWNFSGEAINFAEKSYKSALMIPLWQLLSSILIFIVYKSIAWSKYSISGSDYEKSVELIKVRKYRMSQFVIAMLIIMLINMSISNLVILGLIENSKEIMIYTSFFTFGSSMIIGLYLIYAFYKEKKIESEEEQEDVDFIENDDDKYWKMGMFYVNKNDPSIFIEKRYGIGYTINFGRIEAIVGVVLFIVAILLISVV